MLRTMLQMYVKNSVEAVEMLIYESKERRWKLSSC